MSERKVINKYYPPDFDPEKLPGARKSFSGQLPVRMMLPMSVRCQTCGEYIYKGKKFNARKETVYGEEYLGVRIYRFYMKCPNCCTEFTIKTDPQNSDYIAEVNCARNFEPWKENQNLLDEARQRVQEEEGDAMKALETRSADSKLEMDIMEALDEIRARSAQNAQLTSEELAEHHKRTYEEMKKKEEEADEEEIASVVFKTSSNFVRRVEDEDGKSKERTKEKDGEFTKPLPRPSSNFIKALPIQSESTPRKKAKLNPIVKIVPKNKEDGKTQNGKKESSSPILVSKNSMPREVDLSKEQNSNSDEEGSGISLVDYD